MTSASAPADASNPVDPVDASADGARLEAVEALESSFAELMTAFRRHLAAAADRVHPGMLPGTFKVLSAIARSGPTTLSGLTELLTSDKGLVSRSITELEGLGMIARTLDPEDRRSRLISITPEGAERLSAARAPHQGRLFAVLQDWSVDDITHLTFLLHSLASGETPRN
ncbi:MarR family winged helix-turn-helix transcriptional regulator [Microbacterium sp. P07]|uniref:MarR family winged helix-turn-helix transcriptional regulator n=1 Tax=Microbacterium sp. P07 TaxID=3366952 RepID=UPI003745BBA1